MTSGGSCSGFGGGARQSSVSAGYGGVAVPGKTTLGAVVAGCPQACGARRARLHHAVRRAAPALRVRQAPALLKGRGSCSTEVAV